VATKTLSSHLAAQNLSPPWSRCLVCCTPQPISTFRFSGQDLLLVVVSREFFGPFVRIPYLNKKGVRKIDGKKNISRNHLPTIHWPSRRFLKGPWCPTNSKLFTSMLKPAGPSPKKKTTKNAAGVPFTVNQPPENCGTVKSAGPHRSAAQSLWHWADQFPLQITVEWIHRCVVKIVDLLRLKDWKNLQSTWGCKTDILRLIYQYCPCRTC